MKSKQIALKKGEGLHTHVLTCKTEMDYNPIADLEDAFQLVITREGRLNHEEHGEIILSPGSYISCSQVEFDPMSNNIRQVFD